MPREEAKRLNLNAMVAENDSAHTTAAANEMPLYRFYVPSTGTRSILATSPLKVPK